MSKVVKATIDDKLHAQVKGAVGLAGTTFQKVIENSLRYWLKTLPSKGPHVRFDPRCQKPRGK